MYCLTLLHIVLWGNPLGEILGDRYLQTVVSESLDSSYFNLALNAVSIFFLNWSSASGLF